MARDTSLDAMTSSTHLISAAQLHERLDDARLRIVDATVHLTFDEAGAHVASGHATYLDEHLPGAVFADQLEALSDPDGEAPFAAAPSERFAAAVGALGIGDGDTVVVYDHVNGIWATRLAWQFGLEGYDDVLVLDGGLAAWTTAELPTESGPVDLPQATFTARRRPERLASTPDVVAATERDDVLLVNLLDHDTFAAGRIPGSVNVPFTDLVNADGTLRPLDELRTLFAGVGALDPGVKPVTYCGGGIAATAGALALQALGRDDVAIYDGSMNAWTADAERPLERG